MEKKLPTDIDSELDKLINLLSHPEQLKLRIQYLKQSGQVLSDEIEGFIAYYDTCEGNTDLILEKLATLEKHFTKKHTIKKNRYKSISWAASILILIGTSSYLYLIKYQSKDSFTIKPYEEIGLPNYMGENTKNIIDWKVIMYDFKSRNYHTLLNTKNITLNDTLSYFKGIAAYNLHRFEKSIILLNTIQKTSIYHNKSLYFKALCYYNFKNTFQVKKLIKSIKKEENDPAFNEKVIVLTNFIKQ